MHKYLLLFIGAALWCSRATAQCPVDFYASANGLDVTFYALNPNVDSTFWTFGDGGDQESNQVIVEHTFSEPGTYMVCLSTSGIGCETDTCKPVVICNFVPSYTVEVNGNVAAFNNLSTGDFELVVWEFGDGFTANDTNAIHSYNTPGTYTACLSLANPSSGCISQYCEDVVILGGGDCVNPNQIDSSMLCAQVIDPVCGCNGVTYNNPCEAYHYGGVTSYTQGACNGGLCDASFISTGNGLTLSFTNTSLGDDLIYAWEFGDGMGVSDEMNPTYTYDAPGVYEVCLMIANGSQCLDQVCISIVVTAGPPCNAQYDVLGTCDSAVFVNASTGDITAFSWQINDSILLNVDTVTVTEPGEHIICLTVLADGCQDMICDTISIHQPDAFQPDFEAAFTPDSVPVMVTFSATDTSGLAENFLWSFNGVDTLAGATFIYEATTCSVDVCLTVSADLNCEETVCQSLYVCNVGMASINRNSGFTLYPNPGSDACYLVAKNNFEPNTQLVVTDITGRTIHKTSLDIKQGNAAIVNTSTFASGCYFFNIVSEKQTASLRWIKE